MGIKSKGIGRMDWHGCLKEKIAKSANIDKNMIISARKIASLKIEAADVLPEHLFIGKLTLLYDALRECLECIALENGYKIYNHECYTAFLKEILKMPIEAKLFDECRKARNGINYYGRELNKEEADKIINGLKILIKKFKR